MTDPSVVKVRPRYEQWRYEEMLENGDIWQFTVDVEPRYIEQTKRGLRAVADALEADSE